MEDKPLPPESEVPSSPATAPVRLVDCVEDLLFFTLSSHLDGSLDVDLGLANDYCSRLLQTDPLPVDSNIGGIFMVFLLLCSSFFSESLREMKLEMFWKGFDDH